MKLSSNNKAITAVALLGSVVEARDWDTYTWLDSVTLTKYIGTSTHLSGSQYSTIHTTLSNDAQAMVESGIILVGGDDSDSDSDSDSTTDSSSESTTASSSNPSSSYSDEWHTADWHTYTYGSVLTLTKYIGRSSYLSGSQYSTITSTEISADAWVAVESGTILVGGDNSDSESSVATTVPTSIRIDGEDSVTDSESSSADSGSSSTSADSDSSSASATEPSGAANLVGASFGTSFGALAVIGLALL